MSNNVIKEPDTTAFGEASVAQPEPFTQISSEYGTLDDILISQAFGGTISNIDGMFQAETGINALGLSAATSVRQARYRPGQGILGRVDGVFSAGVANSQQFVGLQTSENFAGFGYDGATFGLLHAEGGALETQTLQVTTPAGVAENATVTVSGIAYIVPLTAGTVQHNAYEISQSLSAQDPAHMFSSNGDTVTALAASPFFPAGAFAFASATAVAVWTQVDAQTSPTETWVAQANWNVNTLASWPSPLDPQKGNQFQVRMCSGFGVIKYYVEDPTNGEFELVHVLENGNSRTTPFSRTPAYRIGGAVRNTGNTTNVILKGTNAALFTEGTRLLQGPVRAESVVAPGIGAAQTNIVAFRNRLVFNGKTNRSEILPLLVSASTDTTKIAQYQIVANPTFVGDLIFGYEDEPDSIMEFATDNTLLTGGDPLTTFETVAGASVLIELAPLMLNLLPDTTFAITAAVSANPASTMSISFTWREDT